MIRKIGIPFDFRIQPELHQEVKKLSKARQVSMADVVRAAIREYVNKNARK